MDSREFVTLDNQREHNARERRVQGIINTGLISNIFLAILKVSIGITGHSRALLADGVNSTSDIVYYIAVKIFTKIAGKPADHEHPYGHHQMESIAAVVVGAFVITTGIGLFWDSVNTSYEIFSGKHPEGAPIEIYTLFVAFFTIILKIFLFIYTKTIGKKTENAAVMALAYDHRNDIFSSGGAAIGITLGWMGFIWADPLAGALVALIILRTGVYILRESSDELMDTVPGETLNKKIRSVVSGISGVKSIEELNAHRFGPYFVINITIGIDGNLSVQQGDAIATEVETRIDKAISPVRKVFVHYHPAKIL
ncbi:MAG TPA: cation diffusion facilitator family transporter [Chitinispirillaceae bacterium]|nr:cation diffusion facilitator family transporter [Chitinispirillaceae bacterium]